MMTMHDRAISALDKARGTLDSAIGTIFGDEQLEDCGAPDHMKRYGNQLGDRVKDPSKNDV
jgi:uncharacterized protein YjbJ (UPF0337 family)